MRAFVAAGVLAAALSLRPELALADGKTCLFERTVGRVLEVAGNPSAARIVHDGAQ